ncbi:MAG: hypothetical protein HYX55_11005 [Chloroflexi bacterium]|nr:hypothetical protein [Chloroflexota bacterium]
MTTHRAAAHGRRLAVAMLGVLVSGIVSVGAVSALQYDDTSPVGTGCTSYQQWTLGTRPPGTAGDEGVPTPILYNGLVIATVEIRHSRQCATVWSRVRNYTGATAQIKEALVTYTDSNGSGRVEHWYPTIDNIPAGGVGISNQYRDRASFSAKGGIFYAGAWRYAETARSVAWVQYTSNFPSNPYACQHTLNWPCKRWPILSNGLSVTRHYYIASGVYSMPNGSGGTLDVSGDVTYMFGQFNNVAAPNPFFYSTTIGGEVQVFSYFESDIVARGGSYDSNDDGLYETGVLQLSTAAAWNTHSSARGTLCQEIDHLMGLNHVWYGNASIDNVGSKATCIGMGSDTGPRIDDVSALVAVYSGVAP